MKVGKQSPNQGSISVAYYRKGQGGRTKALRLKTKNVGGGRTQGIES